ncbi:carboxylesterase/lipase family protein [Nonomuraea lactucae]|uniref:carboxylesterase/lipase family protein n=1 Tax=Nonomuraea lactucae TaxID=2249762 RepID=UPI0013B446E7|nr:carboxylesterase family protein [Nonomuraea lactucae]
MKRRVAIICFTIAGMVAAILAGPVSARTSDPTVVRTDKGWVQGAATSSGLVFRGIPFAAPPTGRSRWRPPGPVSEWSGIRPALRSGGACAQNASDILAIPKITNEDCLYLDVHTPPAEVGGGRRPVVVWLHGGGFVSGSGSAYDAKRLAAKGNVVVTVNYRLGAFGFLAHPALTGEDRRGSGNYGLMDQQAALGWVRANAAAFGGDPGNVTIAGQSAGSGSVCAHLMSPASQGLFQRAVLQSGPCTMLSRSLEEAETAGTDLAHTLGCDTAAPECLRAVPATAVLDASRSDGVAGELLGGLSFAPVSRSPLLPRPTEEALREGAFAKVPTMIGTTRDEATVFVAILMDQLTGRLRLDTPAVRSRYSGDPRLVAAAVLTDYLFACPSRASARALARHNPVHMYEVAERDMPNVFAFTPDFPLGAYHGAELPLLFDLPGRPIVLTPAQRQLSDRMLGYWSRFAATGDPNGPGLPNWPAYSSAQLQSLAAAAVGPIRDAAFERTHHCRFWSSVGSITRPS